MRQSPCSTEHHATRELLKINMITNQAASDADKPGIQKDDPKLRMLARQLWQDARAGRQDLIWNHLTAAIAEIQAELVEARKHIYLAEGYHARTPREIEIANALEETPAELRDSADNTIAELLDLVDAGRSRLKHAEHERDAAQAELKRAREEFEELKAELNEARVLEKEASQMVNAYCGTLANIGDTLRVRGFEKQHLRQQVDEQVIRLAQAHDSLAAEVERLAKQVASETKLREAVEIDFAELNRDKEGIQHERDEYYAEAERLKGELEKRASDIAQADANEMQDILRALTPGGTALKTSARELVKLWEAGKAENTVLKSWKESAMEVFYKCDPQVLGKLLGIPLGSDVFPNVIPKVRAIQAENAALKEQAERMRKELNAAKGWLLEKVFHATERDGFKRTGYTLFADTETAYRDIDYRNCPLFETAQLAVDAAIERTLKEEADAAREGR